MITPSLSLLRASEAEAALAVAGSMQQQVARLIGMEPMGEGALIALGEGRYVNRAIGLGSTIDSREIELLRTFYDAAGVSAALQLSSASSEETIARLFEAGFRPRWFRSVFAGRPASAAEVGTEFTPRLVKGSNFEQWQSVLAEGNGATDPEQRLVSDEYAKAVHHAEGSSEWLVYEGERAIGCGSIQVVGDVAWFGGATTLPAFRSRGIQTALLAHRLAAAASEGCQWVAATALPGSVSASNLLRSGLRLVDTQLVLST